jgi:hypothetical protein
VTVPYACTIHPNELAASLIMMLLLGFAAGAGIVASMKDRPGRGR